MFKNYNDYENKKIEVLKVIREYQRDFRTHTNVSGTDLYDILLDLSEEDLIRGNGDIKFHNGEPLMSDTDLRVSPKALKLLNNKIVSRFSVERESKAQEAAKELI